MIWVVVLLVLLVLHLGATLVWVAHVARMSKLEHKHTRDLLSMYVELIVEQLTQNNEERRKHLNLVQSAIIAHASRTVAEQLAGLRWLRRARPRVRRRRPRGRRVIAPVCAGARMHLDAMLDAVIEAAERTLVAGPFGLCAVDLTDVDGLRFAVVLHEAQPTAVHPAHIASKAGPAARRWCRAASLEVLVPVAAAVLGEDIGAAAEAINAEGAIPVVMVGEGRFFVATPEAAPPEAAS